MLAILPIPPPPIQPSVVVSTLSEDRSSLACGLTSVVGSGTGLQGRRARNTPTRVVIRCRRLLRFRVTACVSGSLPKVPRTLRGSNQPLGSVGTQLGKGRNHVHNGLVNGHISFSTHAIVAPSPGLSLSRMKIPEAVTQAVAVPRIIAPFGVRQLRGFMSGNPGSRPNTECIVESSNRHVSLHFTHGTNRLFLRPNCVIRERLVSNSLILFGQRPSLRGVSVVKRQIEIVP